MELWIRSQGRQLLLQTKVLEINYLGETYVSIRTRYDGISYSLGAYKSEERALEVLDEIQNVLKPQMIISKVGKPIAETCNGTICEPDEYDFKEISTYVYEMPED